MFSKRETFVQNIAFMGIMAAVAALFSLFSCLTPVGGFFLMIVLPASAALTARLCKWRYLPIYVFASIGVSLLVTSFDVSQTLLYTLPSIISGVLTGILIEKCRNYGLSVLFLSAVNTLFVFASILFIKAVYSVDMIEFVGLAFGWTDLSTLFIAGPSLVFLYSVCQTVISYVASLILMNRVMHAPKPKPALPFTNTVIATVFGLASIGMSFLNLRSAYVAMTIGLYVAALVVFEIIRSLNKGVWLLGGFLVIVALAMFPIFYDKAPENQGFLITNAVTFAISFTGIINNWLLLKAHRKNRIKTEDGQED